MLLHLQLKGLTYFLLTLNVVEKFSLLSILENDEYITGCVDELKVFDYVRMVEPPEHFDLSFDFLKDALAFYLALVENFDCYSVICHFVHATTLILHSVKINRSKQICTYWMRLKIAPLV